MKLYARALALSHTPMAYIQADKTLLFANNSFLQLFEISSSKFHLLAFDTPLSLESLVSETNYACLKKHLINSISFGKSLTLESAIDSLSFVKIEFIPEKKAGVVQGVFLEVHDLTKRKSKTSV